MIYTAAHFLKQEKNGAQSDTTYYAHWAITGVFASGRYAAYLNTMSKFHSHRYGNILLILMQNSAATHVAGFQAWKKQFGRNVKAGEHGIRILAPCPYHRFVEQEKRDQNGKKPFLARKGIRRKRSCLHNCTAFVRTIVYNSQKTWNKHFPHRE